MQELSRLQEGVKGEVEGYRKQLSAVRAEQAPWEAQLAELSSRISVATAERDLLLKKQTDAEKRFKVMDFPELPAAPYLTPCHQTFSPSSRTRHPHLLLILRDGMPPVCNSKFCHHQKQVTAVWGVVMLRSFS